MVHHDVKPQNMLLGNHNEVLLSDFGIAVLAHTEGSLTTQEMAGTAQYMAPEQIRGKPRPASDQYALGIVVYEWHCGILPFRGSRWEIIEQQKSAAPSPLHDKVSHLPIAVEEVVLKALAKDPQERFPSVQAFAVALEQASQGKDQLHLVSPKNPSESPLLAGTPQTTTNTDSPAPHPVPQPELSDSTNPVVESEPEHSTDSQPDSPGPGETIVDTVQPPITQPATPPSLPPARTSARPYRRKVTFLVGVVLLLVLVIGGVVLYMLKNLPANYTMFGFDAQHTRFNPQEHTINPSNVSQLKPYWTFSTNGRIAASPAVVDGVVYVASLDGYLYAIDANTSSQRWSIAIQTGSYLESSPAVADGVVYVSSFDGMFYAFDASKGTPLWSASLGQGGGGKSSATVANGLVYIGSDDHYVYAFNASGCGRSSCSPLWSYPAGAEIESSPVVANGVLYVGSLDGKLYSFHLP